MNQKLTRNFASAFGTFAAAMLVAAALFLAGCGSGPSNSVQTKADRAFAAFVKQKFVKLSVSDFKLVEAKQTADSSWEFFYESLPKTDVPVFRLYLTITPDGKELWRAQKQVVPQSKKK